MYKLVADRLLVLDDRGLGRESCSRKSSIEVVERDGGRRILWEFRAQPHAREANLRRVIGREAKAAPTPRVAHPARQQPSFEATSFDGKRR